MHFQPPHARNFLVPKKAAISRGGSSREHLVTVGALNQVKPGNQVDSTTGAPLTKQKLDDSCALAGGCSTLRHVMETVNSNDS